MFIVGWGHGNHAFVKHALRECYLRYPPSSPVVPPPVSNAPGSLGISPPSIETNPLGRRSGVYTVVEVTSATPMPGMQQAALGWLLKQPRTTARDLPTLNLPITPQRSQRFIYPFSCTHCVCKVISYKQNPEYFIFLWRLFINY